MQVTNPPVDGYIARKIFHLVINLPLALLIYYFPPEYIVEAALLGFIAILVFEVIRLKTGAKQYVQASIEPMLKKREKVGLTSVFWTALGVLVLTLFLSPIAISYGFFVFSVADPAAALIGRYTTSIRLYRRKTMNGSFAFFSVAILVTMLFFLMNAKLSPYIPLSVAFALILTLVEMFSYPVDDNVSVLVVGAGLMELFLRFI